MALGIERTDAVNVRAVFSEKDDLGRRAPFDFNVFDARSSARIAVDIARRHHFEAAVETTLYPPVKAFLELLGFEVKGEIGGCDVLAVKAGEPPLVVVCELKTSFNLELVLQGVDRAAACDEVWLAARIGPRGGREADRRFRDLCRRLGFGLLGVSTTNVVSVILSPEAAVPRRNLKRRSRLLSEHAKRQGDPAVGGGTRAPIMTAYRQQALTCAAALADGPLRPRDLKSAAPDAQKILRRNVYGWFTRTNRGVYEVTEAGRQALERWPQVSILSNVHSH